MSTVAGLKIEDRLLFANAVASSYVGNIDGEPPNHVIMRNRSTPKPETSTVQ